MSLASFSQIHERAEKTKFHKILPLTEKKSVTTCLITSGTQCHHNTISSTPLSSRICLPAYVLDFELWIEGSQLKDVTKSGSCIEISEGHVFSLLIIIKESDSIIDGGWPDGWLTRNLLMLLMLRAFNTQICMQPLRLCLDKQLVSSHLVSTFKYYLNIHFSISLSYIFM